MTMKPSFLSRRTLLLAATLPAAARVFAQGAPATVRILVGAPPGGTTDTMARAIAPELGRALGLTLGEARKDREDALAVLRAMRPGAAVGAEVEILADRHIGENAAALRHMD